MRLSRLFDFFLKPMGSIFIISILLINVEAVAQKKCGELLTSATSFIDERFRNIFNRGTDRRQQAQDIHILLREAFWPMLTKFRLVLEATPAIEIHKIMMERKNDTSIMLSPYTHESDISNTIQLTSPETVLLAGKTDFRGEAEALKSIKLAQRAFDASGPDGALRNSFFTYSNGSLEPSAGFEKSFEALWIASSPGEEDKNFSPSLWYLTRAVTPVSAYGKDFSVTLLRTTQVMVEVAKQNLVDESSKIFAGSPQLLKEETARTKDAKHSELGPLSSFIEGIVTYHQFVSAMLVEKVPGAETGDKALHDLIFNGNSRLGLVSEFTARIPMGFIGPMTLSGVHLKHPLVRTPDGKLALSDGMREILKMRKDQKGPRRRYAVCPFASLFKNSEESSLSMAGLQILAEEYWKIFQIVNAESLKTE